MPDFFTVTTQAVLIRASAEAPATVTNLGNGTLYYKTSSDVSSSDSSISSGSKKTFYAANWVVTTTTCKLIVDNFAYSEVDASNQPARVYAWTPVAATSGTDTACSNGTAYVASIYVPTKFLATGVNYLIGSVGGTDKVISTLWNKDGEVVANSATAGATVGTSANQQSVAFTSTVVIPRGRYYIGVTFNGTTAKFRTVPAHTGQGLLGDGVTQTFGTPAAITVPTSFVADKAPVAALY